MLTFTSFFHLERLGCFLINKIINFIGNTRLLFDHFFHLERLGCFEFRVLSFLLLKHVNFLVPFFIWQGKVVL